MVLLCVMIPLLLLIVALMFAVYFTEGWINPLICLGSLMFLSTTLIFLQWLGFRRGFFDLINNNDGNSSLG